jgi:HNH endonuclease
MTKPPRGPMRKKKNYSDPAQCIFCQKEPGTTDEHIIPRGIGGNLIIRHGTCQTCLEKIAPFEARLMNSDFEAARVFLGISSKTGKTRNKLKTPISKQGDNKTLEDKYLHSDKHTGAVIFINYPPPGIEENRYMLERFPQSVSIIVKCFVEEGRPGSVVGPQWDSTDFPRLLAKIAHSYWIAENGSDSAASVLPKFILGDEESGLGYYLGGYHKTSVPGEDLHFLHCGVNVVKGVRYAYVDIGLFSSYGPQTNYRVYIGIYLKNFFPHNI